MTPSRAEVEAVAAERFQVLLKAFGQPWTLTRSIIATEGAAPTPGNPTSVMLTLSWRKGADPLNYREDSAGAVKAVHGTLQSGDVLEHPTHGRFIVQEEGPKGHLGYERAEIKRSS